jgi:hypothetical protein
MQGNSGSRLVVRRGPQPNQTYDLSKDVLSLGRDITNDIVINDPEVSRHHCRLIRTPGGITIEDLGSTNGTFINGQRLAGSRPLLNGDMVGLGETVTLGFEGGAVRAPSAPPQQETMMGGSPQRPASYAQPTPEPAYAPKEDVQLPYAAPEYGAQYAQEQRPAQGYEYLEYEEEDRSSTWRWIAIGCGCLVIVCFLTAVAAAFVIDYFNMWCDVPLMPQLFNLDCTFRGAVLPLLLPLL